MAEEPALCRMQVVDFVEIMRRGERVALDPGIYDVGLTGTVTEAGWVMEIEGVRGGLLSEEEADEAERQGQIRWL